MRKEFERSRITFKTSSSSKGQSQIQKALAKEEETKEGVTSDVINNFLVNIPNFYGCFASDELDNFLFDSLPFSIIVNFDPAGSSGSHWVALHVEKRQVEFFDPLGFDMESWPKFPTQLIEFVRNISFHRRLLISRRLQPENSTLCGFYCIYYIAVRMTNTLNHITNKFSLDLSVNDSILSDLLYKTDFNKF